MDDFTKSMAGTAVGIGSIALVGESLKMVKPMMKPMKQNKHMHPRTNTSAKPLIKGATNLMVGTALLSGMASAIK